MKAAPLGEILSFAPDANAKHLDAFVKFHNTNLHVYDLFRKLAARVKRLNKKTSARTIIERMRWEYEFELNTPDAFKLNNNYTPLYARLLMFNEPAFEGFFETRELIAGRIISA